MPLLNFDVDVLWCLFQVFICIFFWRANSTKTEKAQNEAVAAKENFWRVTLQRPSWRDPSATHHRNQSHRWDKLNMTAPGGILSCYVQITCTQAKSLKCMYVNMVLMAWIHGVTLTWIQSMPCIGGNSVLGLVCWVHRPAHQYWLIEYLNTNVNGTGYDTWNS